MSNQTKSSKTTSNGDRISGLPEPVIHIIMSLLPSKDVTRAGSLSKTWQGLWSTYPNLDFDQTNFERALPEILSDNEKRHLFLTALSRSLQRLEERLISVHKLKLRATVDQDDHLFKFAVERALKGNAKEIDLDYVDLENWFYQIPQCLYSARLVKRVRLAGFKVAIVDLLSGCPSIEELQMNWCNTSEDVKFSSDKLVKFDVQLEVCDGLKSIELEACNLQSFSYYGYSINYNGVRSIKRRTKRTCSISLSTCTFLKNITLKNAKISEQWLEIHISTLVHLEDLCLDSCAGLAKVRIIHQKLKRLHLLSCITIKKADIDCPKLCRFVFEGGMPYFGFFNSSGTLVATLNLHKGSTVSWFIQFRRLLSLFDHCEALELDCDSYKELVFPEEVREDFIPPLHDLQHLKVNCRSSTVDYAELVDNLLWLSPHVETIFLTSKVEKHCLTFQYKMIHEEQGDQEVLFSCCKAYPRPRLCWRHCLQKVILDNFDGTADAEDHQIRLFSYFCENAKGLESIQDNSGIYEWHSRNAERVV